MVNEIWLPVAERDFEDLYEVSDFGYVRRTKTGRLLTPAVMPKGYRVVTLSGRGIRRTTTVHKLVLEAFKRPRKWGEEARHGDGDPSNNPITNLSWGTPSDNTRDKLIHGTMTFGVKNGMATLTEAKVRKIIARYETGAESQSALGAAFGISQTHVSRIVTNKRWSHLK